MSYLLVFAGVAIVKVTTRQSLRPEEASVPIE